MNDEIKLLIADDHPIFRAGLRAMIEKDAQLRIIGEARSGAEALEKIFSAPADVVILDIDMPGGDGFEVARAMLKNNLPAEIIFLTMHKDEDFLHQAVELGVRGYLIKESAVTDIIACIKKVVAGETFISPEIADLLDDEAHYAENSKAAGRDLDALTSTERRVLSLIAEYKTSREIADELFVSFRTIQNHRAHIALKLNIKGNHALIKYAVENKLLIQ